MASNRWVAIDPDILDHPLVGAGQPVAPADPNRGAYSRMEAWIWIICNASFADHTVTNRGRKMTLHRGDVLGAYLFLAHTFNWPRRAVKAWLSDLEEDNMLRCRAIEQQQASQGEGGEDAERIFHGNQATILSVVNYWRYQFDRPEENICTETYTNSDTTSGHQNGHQSVHQFEELSVSKLADKYVLQQQGCTPVGTPAGTPVLDTKTDTHNNNNYNYPSTSNNNPLSEPDADAKLPKKLKRLRKPKVYSEAFEIFWTGYPDRTNNSKLKAFEEWERLEEPDQNAALASLPAFLAYCRKERDYRCIHAERYLRARRWEGFVQQGQTAKVPWWKDPEQLKRLSDDRWRSGIAKYTEGKNVWPLDELGPPPGHRDCKIPERIIDDLRLTELFTPAGIRLQ